MTAQELKTALDNFLVENPNQDVTATLLNAFLTSLIDSSVDTSLSFSDQQLSGNRTIDFDGNNLTFDTVAQMKAVATEFPPLNEGNYDFTMYNSLSDDAGFILRNGAGVDLFSVHSNGNINMGPTSGLGSSDRCLSINSGGNPKLYFGTQFNTTPSATVSLTRRQYGSVGTYNDNALVFEHQSFSDGNQFAYRQQFINPSNFYGGNALNSIDAGFMFFRDSADPTNLQYAVKPDNSIEHYAHPTLTEPVRTGGIGGYIQYAKSSNNVRHPAWIMSDESEVGLFQQDLAATPTTAQIAQFLENLGLANLI